MNKKEKEFIEYLRHYQILFGIFGLAGLHLIGLEQKIFGSLLITTSIFIMLILQLISNRLGSEK